MVHSPGTVEPVLCGRGGNTPCGETGESHGRERGMEDEEEAVKGQNGEEGGSSEGEEW